MSSYRLILEEGVMRPVHIRVGFKAFNVRGTQTIVTDGNFKAQPFAVSVTAAADVPLQQALDTAKTKLVRRLDAHMLRLTALKAAVEALKVSDIPELP